MKREVVYGAWAPEESAWSDWVKPVLFASMAAEVDAGAEEVGQKWLEIATLVAAEPCAILVDLPGAEGVALGVALSHVGYRPVPLYNAVPHRRGFVELEGVVRALAEGAGRLGALSPTAPPAFLLDSLRTTTPRLHGLVAAYDNRSVVRSTDVPSPSRLSSAGIRRALLIRTAVERPAPDLEAVLLAWQREGIELWRLGTDEVRPAQRFVLATRPWYVRAWAWLTNAAPHPRGDGAYGRFWFQGG